MDEVVHEDHILAVEAAIARFPSPCSVFLEGVAPVYVPEGYAKVSNMIASKELEGNKVITLELLPF